MADGSCFVSYCHEDCDPAAVSAFVAALKQQAHGDFKVFHDDNDVAPGGDIDAFMRRLSLVDAVIILMTPAYRRKVLRREKSVYTEFSKIWSRYETSESARRDGSELSDIARYFDIIPILWSGEPNDAVPPDIEHLRYVDFTSFRPPLQRRSTHIEGVARIADTIRTVIQLKKASFKETYFRYRRLFTEVKAGGRGDAHERWPEIFVKTDAYKRVEKQEACFLIGRKGSGKSSVVQSIWLLRGSAYDAHIELVADNFNFGNVYNLLTSNQMRSDLTDIFRRVECYRYAWEAFLYLAAMAQLSGQRNALPRTVQQLLRRRLRLLVSAGRGMDLRSRESLTVFFLHAFECIPLFIDECIAQARPDELYFRSDIQARFTRRQFVDFVVGQKELRAFNRVMQSNGVGRLFVTLDGFDTAFGLFRRTTSLHPSSTAPPAERAAFEVELVAAFLMEVNRIRRTRQDENAFHSLMDFCITVPRDLFLEVPKVDRDSYRYHSSYCALNWTGIELAIMLRKRLLLLAPGADAKKGANQEARLQAVWRKACSRVSWHIRVPFGSAFHDMPLFMYVLRHTFWRPRDVLLHYAKIIALGREGRGGGATVSSDQIRRVVRDTTYEIIHSEFLNEFEYAIPSLPQVLERFRGRKQFLPFAEVAAMLEGADLRSAADDAEGGAPMSAELELLGKLKLLYDIGVLGIEVPADLQKQFHILHHQAFYFNEGNTLFKGGKLREALTRCRFIVHPIFTEYLELDNSGEPFTLQFSWKYLHDVEDVITASSGEGLF